MKRLKFLIFIVWCIFTITIFMKSLEFVYADSLVYVSRDYCTDSKNAGLDYLNLYIKGVNGKISNVLATIDNTECEVSYYDLNSNDISNNVYFLISISNFDNTVNPEKVDKTNSKVQTVLKYLLQNKDKNSNYYFYNSLITSNARIDICNPNDVDNLNFTIGNCANNNKLDSILTIIKSKHTPSKIVLISDGTNYAYPTITSDYIIQELKTVPCEVIPITVEPLKSIDTYDDINIYNLTNAKNFNLNDLADTSKMNVLINQISDWNNTKIFQVDLNSFDKNGQSKILNLFFTDDNGVNTITFPFELPSVNRNAPNNNNISFDKKTIIIIVILIIIIIILVIIIIVICLKKGNKSKNFINNKKTINSVKLPNNFTIILNDIDRLDKYFQINISLNSSIIIGKSSQKCDLVIDYEPSVSRQHCKIFFENGYVFIEDLNSSYYTYVNKHKIETCTKIQSGDIISLGSLNLSLDFKI